MLTVQALARNHNALRCKVCKVADCGSKWEDRCYNELQDMEVPEIVTEVKVLRGHYGAADIWLVPLQILIMVDGEGHLRCKHHQRDAAVQIQTDIRFVIRAYHLGYSVLRLGCDDMDDLAVLLESLMAAEQPAVVLSKSSRKAMQLPMNGCFVTSK